MAAASTGGGAAEGQQGRQEPERQERTRKLVGHAFVRWAILGQGGGDAAMAEADPEAEEPFLEDETWEEPEAVAGS